MTTETPPDDWILLEAAEQAETCPHCNKSGDASGMIRWHFERCKYNVSS